MIAVKKRRDFLPWFLMVGVTVVVAAVMSLFVTIIQGDKRNADQKTQIEKTRADTLQKSVDSLRARADQDRQFFELVRQLLISQSVEQRKALLNQLGSFKFVEPSTPPPAPKKVSPPTTTTTKPPSSTTRAPPSSTTTTSTTIRRAPPPTTCVSVPIVARKICP